MDWSRIGSTAYWIVFVVTFLAVAHWESKRPERQWRIPAGRRWTRHAILLIVGTLMVPLSVILVPLYSVVSAVGLFDSLWGVILPTVATPTGVFLLRQYMLTIPDELIDAARMDNASEWQIYWRIILPLSAPALAVLAIFSVVWRWNDFLWPLVVLSRKELYTLQVGLNTYAGQLNVQWHYILAMTVVTMIPVVLVFVLLQRYITSGIAGSGLFNDFTASPYRSRSRLTAQVSRHASAASITTVRNSRPSIA